MGARRDLFRKPLEDLKDEDSILVFSIFLIFLALLASGFDYYYIDLAMTLFFYAVIVRIWTQMGSDVPTSSKRDWAHVEFLIMAIAAVVIGIQIEWAVSYITGDMVAAQSLALAAVISRLYINMRDSNATSLKEIIRWNQIVDRYLVLVPCAVAFFAPVLVYQLDIYSVSFETRESFFGLVAISFLIGIGLYEYEKD